MARDLDLLWDISTGELTFATATAARTVGNYLKRMETVVMNVTVVSDGVADTTQTGATLTTKPVNVYDNVLATWTLAQVGSTNILSGSQTLNSDAITTLLGTTIEKWNCVLDIATAAHLESETLAIVLQNNVVRSTDGTPTPTAASITSSGYTIAGPPKLLGRGTAGTGAIELITLGAGLTMTGTTLSASGSGTVTSVGLSVPAFLSVSNSPITTTGTLAVTLAPQVQKTFFAGPTSGADATPAFRVIAVADVPTLNQNTSGNAATATNVALAGITGAGAGVLTALANALDGTGGVASKAYADSLVVGLIDDRGNFDASGNAFPSSGGSGTAGAILKGDLWLISVAGTLGGSAVTAGDQLRALTNTPGQTAGNWAISEANIGYVPLSQTLANGSIFVGNVSNIATAQALGTGVATALSVNIGSAGAFITFNGDAGTPSALVGTNITGNAANFTVGNATLAATITAANEGTDTTCFLAFFNSATGALAIKTNAGLLFNAASGRISNSGIISATTFQASTLGNDGGMLDMQATASALGGNISTKGGSGSDANGGTIDMSGGSGSLGSGGTLDMSGKTTIVGGSLTLSNGVNTITTSKSGGGFVITIPNTATTTLAGLNIVQTWLQTQTFGNVSVTGTLSAPSSLSLVANSGSVGISATTFVQVTPKLLIGTQAAPSALMEAQGTTEQLRLRYDASNYLTVTVSSVGLVTLDGAGASKGISIAGTFAVTGHTTFEGVTSTGATGTGKIVYDGSPVLVTPTIASFTNATHNHTNAAGGGTLAETAFAFTDVTTANVSTTKHGLAPKLPNDATKYLDGTGAYNVPTGGGGSSTQTINDQTGNGAYTFVLADAGKLVILDAGNHTMPTNASVAFPIGTSIDVRCNGSVAAYNASTIQGAAPPTINGGGNGSVFAQQSVRLQQVAVNVWVFSDRLYPATDGIVKALSGVFSNAAAGTDYVAPGGAGTVVADTGWTANADAGDKTDVIPSSGTIATLVGALDPTNVGYGALLQAVAEKCKAIEAVLLTFKVPNA